MQKDNSTPKIQSSPQDGPVMKKAKLNPNSTSLSSSSSAYVIPSSTDHLPAAGKDNEIVNNDNRDREDKEGEDLERVMIEDEEDHDWEDEEEEEEEEEEGEGEDKYGKEDPLTIATSSADLSHQKKRSFQEADLYLGENHDDETDHENISPVQKPSSSSNNNTTSSDKNESSSALPTTTTTSSNINNNNNSSNTIPTPLTSYQQKTREDKKHLIARINAVLLEDKRIFDDCDEIRRKIRDFMREQNLSKTFFCRRSFRHECFCLNTILEITWRI